MIFGENRTELRQMYATAWCKFCADEVLSPLEAQIAAVIEQHPEYHPIITAGQTEATFSIKEGQINPFLHMGLHLERRDQLSTDRPPGVAAICRASSLIHTPPNIV